MHLRIPIATICLALFPASTQANVNFLSGKAPQSTKLNSTTTLHYILGRVDTANQGERVGYDLDYPDEGIVLKPRRLPSNPLFLGPGDRVAFDIDVKVKKRGLYPITLEVKPMAGLTKTEVSFEFFIYAYAHDRVEIHTRKSIASSQQTSTPVPLPEEFKTIHLQRKPQSLAPRYQQHPASVALMILMGILFLVGFQFFIRHIKL